MEFHIYNSNYCTFPVYFVQETCDQARLCCCNYKTALNVNHASFWAASSSFQIDFCVKINKVAEFANIKRNWN